ncbi:MAG: gamma-glutamylcyclotransferase family protein [Pseudomonadota bacterium]
MPPADRYVFVYGTLRRGEERDINRLHPAPEYVGKASMTGRLFDLGTYPGLVLGGEGAVQGEVYRISAALERLLDEIEEVWPQQTGEYAKREVKVDLAAAEAGDALYLSMQCLVYEIAIARTTGHTCIESGDWVKYRICKAG